MTTTLAVLTVGLIASIGCGRIVYLRGRKAERDEFEAKKLPYLVGRAKEVGRTEGMDVGRREGHIIGYSEGKIDGERVGLGRREMAEKGI